MFPFSFASLRHTGVSVATSTHLALKTQPQLRTLPFFNSRRLFHVSPSAKSTGDERDPLARAHLSSFFAQYPDFKYDPSQPFMDEFWRLIETNKYGRRGKKYKAARRGVKDAIIREFRDIYGTHSCSPEVWYKFFQAIGINEEFQDVGPYHKRAKSINLNVCDLIDRTVTGIVVKDFSSVKELSDYTFKDIQRPKIAPPISKKEDPIVGRLFRNLTNPAKAKVKIVPSIQNTPATATEE
ncbi:unnamed protein product [Rhizoctonia solani]|uniref:Uncharacterized protein n=1 Tax=Rhizoctonia solani TaxID=456999 RepID=A0A8H3A3T8_9AGAM|nr:unnamed protein product [Rhizoctonia solani]